MQVFITIAVTYFINQRMKREVHLACEEEAAHEKEKLIDALPRVQYSSDSELRTSHSVNDFHVVIPRLSSVSSMGLDDVSLSAYESVPEEDERDVQGVRIRAGSASEEDSDIVGAELPSIPSNQSSPHRLPTPAAKPATPTGQIVRSHRPTHR